jgi:hypothetical protein
VAFLFGGVFGLSAFMNKIYIIYRGISRVFGGFKKAVSAATKKGRFLPQSRDVSLAKARSVPK